MNIAVFSACANTNEVFDLKPTDTYLGSGDQVFIEADSFVQTVNSLTALLRLRTQFHSVLPVVRAGTRARLVRAVSNLYSNLTPCNGQTPPAFVSFEGMIQVPQ